MLSRAERFAAFRRALREKSLKSTAQRDDIARVFFATSRHLSIDELYREVRKVNPRVGYATVYRTIKLLQDAGIIQRVMLDQEQSHYQLVYGQKPRDFIIRVDTHQAIPIDIPELVALRDRLCKERGLKAEGHRFQIFAVGI